MVAVLVGLEFEVDARVAVPPLFAMLVVAALVVIRGEGVWASAVVAVVTGTVVSWSLGPVRTVRRVVVASSLAAGATALAVGASELVGSRHDMPAAFGAATVFAVVVASVGSGRRARLVAFGWSAPLVALTFATAVVWHTVGAGGAPLAFAWLAVVAVAAATWGSPPWAGRWVARVSTRVHVRARRALLLGIAVTACTSGVVAVACPPGDPRTAAAGVAVALATSVATACSLGVRQWRFAPRSRAIAASMVGFAVILALGAGRGLAAGHAWAVLVMVLSVALAVAAGWNPSRRADEAHGRVASESSR